MHRIMFVCHGNICRSTMAEFVMRDMTEKEGCDGEFHIASSATSTDDIGMPVYPNTKRILAAQGISCEGKRAVQLRADDYDKYDLFIGMDEDNISEMRRILRGDAQRKVHKLLEYVEDVSTDDASDVDDPYYTRDFDTTYRDVVRGCRAILRCLTENERA